MNHKEILNQTKFQKCSLEALKVALEPKSTTATVENLISNQKTQPVHSSQLSLYFVKYKITDL